MAISRRYLQLLSAGVLVAWTQSPVMAKGLEELSQENPEEKPPEDPEAAPEEGAEEAAVPAEGEETPAVVDTPPTPRPAAVVNKLFLATSFGWGKAMKSEGEWKGGGTSDVTVGYLLPFSLGQGISLFGTYRYAPIAVTGDIDDRSYRGVFEAHNFGALGHYKIKEGLRATASFELGYVLVYLDPLDGIDINEKHESDGGVATLGGGADWQIFEKVQIGPRLYAGFGNVTMLQLGASATVVF